jgi:hypothetical protein
LEYRIRVSLIVSYQIDAQQTKLLSDRSTDPTASFTVTHDSSPRKSENLFEIRTFDSPALVKSNSGPSGEDAIRIDHFDEQFAAQMIDTLMEPGAALEDKLPQMMNGITDEDQLLAVKQAINEFREELV